MIEKSRGLPTPATTASVMVVRSPVKKSSSEKVSRQWSNVQVGIALK